MALRGQSSGSTDCEIPIIEDFVDHEDRPLLYPAIRPIKSISELPYEYHRAGTGEVSGISCGSIKFFTACVAKDHEHRLFSKRAVHARCASLLCPTCYEGASRRSSKRIAVRLNGLHAKYLAKGIRLGVPKHFEFSPPTDHWTMEQFLADGGKAAFAEVTALLDEYAQDGIYGGDLILHLERRKHKDGTECRRKDCTHRHVWVWGPHFHYIGYGFMANSDYFYSQSGWVYKRIEDHGSRDLEATAFYILTHSAVFVKKASGRSAKNHRYVGLFQDKLAKRVNCGKREESCLCSECHVSLHRFGKVLGSEDEISWEDDRGEATRVVHDVDWVIRERSPMVKRFMIHERPKEVRPSKPLPASEVHMPFEAYDYELKRWLGFNVDSDEYREYLRSRKEGATKCEHETT